MCFRNFFPDNLAQACFQHTKTQYYNRKEIRKRLVETNATDVLDGSSFIVNSTTGVPLNISFHTENVTKMIVQYEVDVEKKGLAYGNGINVLGKEWTGLWEWHQCFR